MKKHTKVESKYKNMEYWSKFLARYRTAGTPKISISEAGAVKVLSTLSPSVLRFTINATQESTNLTTSTERFADKVEYAYLNPFALEAAMRSPCDI